MTVSCLKSQSQTLLKTRVPSTGSPLGMAVSGFLTLRSQSYHVTLHLPMFLLMIPQMECRTRTLMHLIANNHIQLIFFLDDADNAEIAIYIDFIIAAIHANLKRHMEYLRNPSPQLQREITEHSMSIAAAEKCMNVHI